MNRVTSSLLLVAVLLLVASLVGEDGAVSNLAATQASHGDDISGPDEETDRASHANLRSEDSQSAERGEGNDAETSRQWFAAEDELPEQPEDSSDATSDITQGDPSPDGSPRPVTRGFDPSGR